MMHRYRIILHVFTSDPSESWTKIAGEPGVYALDDHITYKRLRYAKDRARWRLEKAPNFPNDYCYVVRAYVWDNEGDGAIWNYQRGEVIEKEGYYGF